MTPRTIQPKRKPIYNAAVWTWQFEVRTPSGYGGHIVTRHMSEDEAAGRVRQLQRDGQEAEIISTSTRTLVGA